MTKNYYVFLCLIVCSFFSSCDDDEKETIPPVVTIQSPNGTAMLNGIVTIAAQATDNSGISSMRILLDENLLHETGDAEVSHDWNTETASDGAHTITVVAIDAVGNEGTETLTVEVFNDKKAPVVTLTSPATQPFVKSTIKIDGSVVDDSAIESIKIFVDEVLLTTLSNTASFSFDWDTKGVADGNHTIRVTAIDNRSNESTVTMNVNVFNYFMTINFEDPEVPSHVALWYMVSKYDGTLLGAKPYVAGDTKIRFETPDDFNPADRYVFSVFQNIGKYQNYSIQKQYYAQAGLSAGEMTITPQFTYFDSSPSTLLGYHTINVTNVPAYLSFSVSGVGSYSSSLSNNTLKIDLGIYDFNTTNGLNPRLTLLRTPDEPARFKDLGNVQVGGTTPLDFDDLVPMIGKKLAAGAGATYTYDQVFGVANQSYNETNRVWDYYGSFDPNKVAHYLYHPEGAFSEYLFVAQEGSDNENNFSLQVASEVPTTLPRSNAAITAYTKENNRVTLNTSGTYDAAFLSGSKNEDANGEYTYYFWSLQVPDGNSHDITLPQLPTELASYNFPDLAAVAFTNATFTDYSGFDTYDDVRSFQLANPDISIYTVSKTYVSKSIALPNPGGRLKGDLFNQTLKLMLENDQRMGLNRFHTLK